MMMRKKILANNETLSEDDRKIIEKIAYKKRKYGRIDFLMSLSEIGEEPKLYEGLESIEFKLTSNSAENLNKLEKSFDNEIKEALGDKVRII